MICSRQCDVIVASASMRQVPFCLAVWLRSYPQDSNGSQDAVMKALQLLLNLMLFSNLASDRSWSDALEVNWGQEQAMR